MNKSRKLETDENQNLRQYMGESTIGDQSRRTGGTPSTRRRRPQNETARSEAALHERIASKAYELYQRRGCEHGHDAEDWFEAERLVRGANQAEGDRKGTRRRKPRPRGEP